MDQRKDSFRFAKSPSPKTPVVPDRRENKLICTFDKSNTPEPANQNICCMTFHVTDATKMLASVGNMTAAGNEVVFSSESNYILSKKTGKRAHLRKEKGIFILDAVILNGDTAEQGEIIIDSGAADNVMPEALMGKVALQPAQEGVKFSGPNGKEMKYYGRRELHFVPIEFWESEFGYPFTGPA